jgi:hypothetical protein
MQQKCNKNAIKIPKKSKKSNGLAFIWLLTSYLFK